MENLEAEDKLNNFEIQNLSRSLLRRVYKKFASIFSRNVKLLTDLIFYISVFVITNQRFVVAANKRSIFFITQMRSIHELL